MHHLAPLVEGDRTGIGFHDYGCLGRCAHISIDGPACSTVIHGDGKTRADRAGVGACIEVKGIPLQKWCPCQRHIGKEVVACSRNGNNIAIEGVAHYHTLQAA